MADEIYHRHVWPINLLGVKILRPLYPMMAKTLSELFLQHFDLMAKEIQKEDHH